MSSNRISFTKKALEALPPAPAGKRIDYYDTKTQGLTLRVSSSGTKTFSFFRRIDGKLERVTIGKFPTPYTVEMAQKEAAKLNGKVASGINPAEQKRNVRQEITLGEHFDDYLKRHAMPYKKSWKNDDANYRLYLSPLAKRKLNSIKKAEVQRLHARIGKEHGIYAANRTLATLRKVFAVALDWGWEGSNPCIGVKQFKEQSRDRFLQGDELPRFFAALAEEANETARDFFTLSLLTGARRGNLLAMRWEEVSLERGIWRIPMTKNGDAQNLPLTGEALAILQQRQAQAEGPWVFPGNGSASGHMEEPKTAWKRILGRAGLSDLRIHDLRRSLGSWQAATGASLSVIGKSLNHRNVSTTAIYARLNVDPVRESMEKATAAMLAAGGLTETDNNVVELRKKA
ncbi:MAG: tyrosine-type recombinase/integrase [Gammaproteobacteria bacterium]|nr:tyrosine-type recombinase/integrase [Gammaproteobacteria bacterium]